MNSELPLRHVELFFLCELFFDIYTILVKYLLTINKLLPLIFNAFYIGNSESINIY